MIGPALCSPVASGAHPILSTRCKTVRAAAGALLRADRTARPRPRVFGATEEAFVRWRRGLSRCAGACAILEREHARLRYTSMETIQGTSAGGKLAGQTVDGDPRQRCERVFVSYSVHQKGMAGVVKSRMEDDCGLQCFLAHEDIQVSEVWRHRILEELRRADVFVAVLSKDFRASDWCEQEVGLALSRPEVLIIPLSRDGTMPCGFISHLQGRRVEKEHEVLPALQEVLFRERPRHMIPKQIQNARSAGSFRSAEAVVKPLVPHFASFTDEEVNDFAAAAAGNLEVWDASLCRREYIPEFVERCGSRIAQDHASELKKVIPGLNLP